MDTNPNSCKDELDLVWKSHHALNDKLKVVRAELKGYEQDSAQWCADSENIQKAIGVERISDCVPAIDALRAERDKYKDLALHETERARQWEAESNRLRTETHRLISDGNHLNALWLAGLPDETRLEIEKLRTEVERLRNVVDLVEACGFEWKTASTAERYLSRNNVEYYPQY